MTRASSTNNKEFLDLETTPFSTNSLIAGNEFQVNSYTTYYQSSPSVTRLNNGSFVITWTSYEQDGDSSGVYGQVFDPNGNQVGAEFQVNTYTTDDQSDPSVNVPIVA